MFRRREKKGLSEKVTFSKERRGCKPCSYLGKEYSRQREQQEQGLSRGWRDYKPMCLELCKQGQQEFCWLL